MDYQLDADNCVTYPGDDSDNATDRREREFGPMADRITRKMVAALTSKERDALIDALTDPDYKGRMVHILLMTVEDVSYLAHAKEAGILDK